MITHEQVDRYRILGWLTRNQAAEAHDRAELPRRLDVPCAVCEDPECKQRAVFDIGGVW